MHSPFLSHLVRPQLVINARGWSLHFGSLAEGAFKEHSGFDSYHLSLSLKV